MTMEVPPPTASFLKQTLLRLMLILVAVGVAVAIVAVLRGEPLGETFSKVVTTSLGTGLFAALALGCADAAERKPSFLSYAGVGVACFAVAVFFVGVWFEQARYPGWWKWMTIATVHAIALWRCARFTLVTLTGWQAIVVRVTMLAVLGVAACLSLAVVRERFDDVVVRVMNALWILAIGGHVAVPILQRLKEGADRGPPRGDPKN